MSAPADLLALRLREAAAVKISTAEDAGLLGALGRIADVLVACNRGGGTIFWCGNGGSSTDAEHLSAELLGHFALDRPAMSSVSLASNTAAMTAIGNDYGYAETFSRQLAGLARPGDAVIAMSTSGGSPNVVAALEQARRSGVTAIAFTGAAGGAAAAAADLVFRAPSTETPRVQECHMTVGHTLCEIVEAAAWGPGGHALTAG